MNIFLFDCGVGLGLGLVGSTTLSAGVSSRGHVTWSRQVKMLLYNKEEKFLFFFLCNNSEQKKPKPNPQQSTSNLILQETPYLLQSKMKCSLS